MTIKWCENGRRGQKAHAAIFDDSFETLMNAVIELEAAYNHFRDDLDFIRELTYLFSEYAGRPSLLYYAEKMAKDLGGAKIYLKRGCCSRNFTIINQ